MQLPKVGSTREDIVASIRERKQADADWRGGRTWSLIYPAGEDVDAVLRDANELYLFENALNPFRFPSLRHSARWVRRAAQSLAGASSGSTGPPCWISRAIPSSSRG